MKENAVPVFWVNNSIDRHFICWLHRFDPVKPGFLELRSPILRAIRSYKPLGKHLSWCWMCNLVHFLRLSGSYVMNVSPTPLGLALTHSLASSWLFFHPPISFVPPSNFFLGSKVPILLVGQHESFIYLAALGVSWDGKGWVFCLNHRMMGMSMSVSSVSISPPMILVSDNWLASASVYKALEILGRCIFSHTPGRMPLRSVGCSKTDIGVISELSDLPVVFAFYNTLIN